MGRSEEAFRELWVSARGPASVKTESLQWDEGRQRNNLKTQQLKLLQI